MLQAIMPEYIHAVEDELKRVVETTGLHELKEMLAYHMGWEGEGAGPEARGKRIRPLLVLLSAAGAGGDWRAALPAAASVELIHNFSLIHDDIEDRSPLRRGRPTVWNRWGEALAINAGDTMFALGQQAMLRLAETVSPQAALQAMACLQQTCLALTQGQHLDISYEHSRDAELGWYWAMIAGKTGALLEACTRLGALCAEADETRQQHFAEYGRSVGLAFQVIDDLLGIWGDSALTGKSTESDLVSGKKSLPVLYGLEQRGAFARRWAQGPIAAEEVGALAAMLEAEGVRRLAQEKAEQHTKAALAALDAADPQGDAGQALRELTDLLLQRSA